MTRITNWLQLSFVSPFFEHYLPVYVLSRISLWPVWPVKVHRMINSSSADHLRLGPLVIRSWDFSRRTTTAGRDGDQVLSISYSRRFLLLLSEVGFLEESRRRLFVLRGHWRMEVFAGYIQDNKAWFRVSCGITGSCNLDRS